MSVKCFRDLDVLKKAHSFVLDIYKITADYPKCEQFGLTNQMRRAAVSICANIAEGNKKSTKEYLRFIDISQGSLEESKYYLLLSHDLGYFSDELFNKKYSEAEDVGRMLNALSRSLRA